MTSERDFAARPGGAGRHRLARRRAPRTRLAVLAASLGLTLLVAVLAAVRPAEQPLPDGGTPAPRNWAAEATLDPLAPAAEPTAEPTPDPEPTDVPQHGDGTFTPASVRDIAAAGSGRDRRVSIEVEDGLPQDRDVVADQVVAVLGDERGWRSDGWSFTHVRSDPDVRILLASPDTVDRLCAPLLTRGEVSCRAGDLVVLNVKRWVRGVEHYDDLDAYRTYLVNHEVGHALGKYHVGCPSPGAKAPVMLQQTKGLQGCTPNPWP